MSRFLISAVLACIPLAFAAASDAHTSTDPACVLYRQSSWAHGYIHGYEYGYHFGNRDLHLNTPARDVRKLKEYKESKRVFRQDSGDGAAFDSGYKAGMEVGYADGVTGQAFRAAQQARSVAPGIKEDRESASGFDTAMGAGYKHGRSIGLSDGRLHHAFTADYSSCPQDSAATKNCAGYVLGYRWGYSDGYLNQYRPDQVRAARK